MLNYFVKNCIDKKKIKDKVVQDFLKKEAFSQTKEFLLNAGFIQESCLVAPSGSIDTVFSVPLSAVNYSVVDNSYSTPHECVEWNSGYTLPILLLREFPNSNEVLMYLLFPLGESKTAKSLGFVLPDYPGMLVVDSFYFKIRENFIETAKSSILLFLLGDYVGRWASSSALPKAS